jgi:hypothetical protein
MIQKLPETSIEVRRQPWTECSPVKSSKKVRLPAGALSGSISEESARTACPARLNEVRLWLRLIGGELFTSHLLRRIIAAPIVRLRWGTILVWGGAWNAEGEKEDCCTTLIIRPTPPTTCRQFLRPVHNCPLIGNSGAQSLRQLQ